MIGRARVTRRGAGRAVLAVAIAAVVASLVYFGGRALGLGGSSPAAGQSDSPLLTIRVPDICETRDVSPGYGSVWGEDDEGNWVRTGTYGPFYQLADIDTVELAWNITGGTEPYEVSVQGQTLLSGPTGSTLVYCAESLPYGELDFSLDRDDYDRTELDDPPEVNPGPITFEATVKDAGGQSNKAKAQSYIILDCDRYCDFEVLPSGYTYRLFGELMTIPRGLDIYIAEYGENTVECLPGAKWCASHYELQLLSDGGGAVRLSTHGTYLGYVWNNTIYYPDGTTWPEAAQVGGQVSAEHPRADELEKFGRSIGRRPSLSGN